MSLLEVVEQLEIAVPPDAQPPYQFPFSSNFVVTWSRDDWDAPEEGKMRVRMRGPSSETLGEFEASIDLQSASRNRAVTQLDSFIITATGIQEFEVAMKVDDDWVVVDTYPVETVVKVLPGKSVTT